MNRKLLVAVAFASAACTTPVTIDAARAADHFINVTVDAATRTIEVNVPELRVRGPNHNIFWTVHNGPGQSYSFPEDGIHFKSDAGRSEFKCMRQNPRRFKCHDAGTTKGRFEYGVKLQGTPAVPVLDPFVINN